MANRVIKQRTYIYSIVHDEQPSKQSFWSLLKWSKHQNNRFSPCSSGASIKTTILALAQCEQPSKQLF